LHFHENVLPRRIKEGPNQYRKVAHGEEDRGELYPRYTSTLSALAHFGSGIGIYFLQLLILAGLLFFGGIAMVFTIINYQNSGYGFKSTANRLITISAACSNGESYNTTLGCSNGESICNVHYRGNCELPHVAGLSDLAMSLFIMVSIYIAQYFESKFEQGLNDSIQTASDYSIMVADPDSNADDPDLWEQFFRQFGQVRYVTIARKNKSLCELVVKKHEITRKLTEFGKIPVLNSYGRASELSWLKKYDDVNKELMDAYKLKYPVTKVFVTFEYESAQRKCLSSMEVPDIAAILDLKSDIDKNFLFRLPGTDSTNVLDVRKASEPNDIKWENIETDKMKKMAMKAFGNICVLASLVGTYFVIIYAKEVSSFLLAAAIAIMDVMLAALFEIITDWGTPKTEGKKQSSLQIKLFAARLLISTVFPYILASWDVFLDVDFIAQIINVQLSACFLSPLINFLDLGGLVGRNIIAPIFSQTQAELNSKWSGSNWSLAERYTVVSKILFISLFYALLTPVSLFIGGASFVLLYYVDRYLLMRKWAPVGMLDASISVRLRQQAIFCVGAHMYITLRMIYSWPMDNAYKNNDGDYVKIDKYPPYNVLTYQAQDWHTDSQKSLIQLYKICFIVVAVVTALLWIFIPLYQFVSRMFCKTVYPQSDAEGVGFSKLQSVMAYVPLLKVSRERFICSYMEGIQPQNRPVLLRSTPEDKDDLSSYVPIEYQQLVLSIVKHYDDDNNDDDNKMRRIIANNDDRDHIKYIISVPPSPTKDQRAQVLSLSVREEASLNREFASMPLAVKTSNTSAAGKNNSHHTTSSTNMSNVWDPSTMRSLLQHSKNNIKSSDVFGPSSTSTDSDAPLSINVSTPRTSGKFPAFFPGKSPAVKDNSVMPEGVLVRPNRKVSKKQFVEVNQPEASPFYISTELADSYESKYPSDSPTALSSHLNQMLNRPPGAAGVPPRPMRKGSYRVVLRPINRIEPSDA